jgi:hypothetical protein
LKMSGGLVQKTFQNSSLSSQLYFLSYKTPN